MNLARALGNDQQVSIAGELLADTQPYVPILGNKAYRDLQRDLTAKGVETLAKETIITGLPAVASPDPGVNVSLSFTGFNNGTTNTALPALPADLLGPLRIWERPTGQVSQFIPMHNRLDGLPSVTQSSCLKWWQWLQDQLVMIGSLQSNDIKMRYNQRLPALVLSPVPSPVLIINAMDAMAWRVIALFCQARGGEGAVYADQQYEIEKSRLIAPTTKRRQRAVAMRKPWGGRRSRR
jgi:hypothetical protein